jgi:hypothetical protein
MASANEQLAVANLANLANLHKECNIPQRNVAGGNAFGAGAIEVLFGNDGATTRKMRAMVRTTT